jgi:Zn-dependent M28 family amino/carboxypeptidase
LTDIALFTHPPQNVIHLQGRIRPQETDIPPIQKYLLSSFAQMLEEKEMKMKRANAVLLTLLIGGVVPSTAQVTAPAWTPSTLETMRQVRSSALRDDYGYERLAHLADSIGPRPVGSLQVAEAVNYVAGELGKLGFEIRLEKVRVPRWVRGEDHGELISYPGQVTGTTQRLVVAALAGQGVATPPDGIAGEVLIVNSLAEFATVPREKVAGKIVLFNQSFDERMAGSGFAFDAYDRAVEPRNDGRIAAAKAGAAAVLVRSVGGARFRLVHVGATDYFNVARLPAAAITAEDADLVARLASRGKVRLRLTLVSNLQEEVDSYNVIADLKGAIHPEQIVIVSGHLDSWDLGTGALDDGAGVAIAMAAAKLIREQNVRPDRTIRIVAWMGEERGLLGARSYAKEHASEMENHFAAIEIDSGAGHAMGFYTTGDPSLPTLFSPVAEILAVANADITRDLKSPSPDLIPLYFRGVPAFAPIQDTRKYFDYHHTAADTLDKVVPQELRENIAVVAVLSYALATMKQELPRQKLTLPEWLK